jgi:hypothetical protein
MDESLRMMTLFRKIRISLGSAFLLFWALAVTALASEQRWIEPEHAVYSWIERYVAELELDFSLSAKPHSIAQINSALRQISALEQLTAREKAITQRWLSWLSPESIPENGLCPLVKRAFSYSESQPEPALFLWQNERDTLRIDFHEMFRLEFNGEALRPVWQDGIHFSANLGSNAAIFLDGVRYLYLQNEQFPNPPQEFKGGRIGENDEGVQYNSFESARAGLRLSHSFGDFALAKYPIVWGNSAQSLILSGNASPFAWLGWNKSWKIMSLHFFHGALMPGECTIPADSLGRQCVKKYIVGHRWELKPLRGVELAFYEVYLYGNRTMELDYLIPPALLYPTEHDLMDRDNGTMAFEATLRRSAFKLYGTLFLDELRLSEFFGSWWGNKQGIQAGISLFGNIASFPINATLELTAVRPWTYTHKYAWNSYTHHGVGLGFPLGPNSQQLFAGMELFLSPRSDLAASFTFQKKGADTFNGFPSGSEPNQNYEERDQTLDFSTPWLLGEISEKKIFNLAWRYQWSDVISTVITLSESSKDGLYTALQTGIAF